MATSRKVAFWSFILVLVLANDCNSGQNRNSGQRNRPPPRDEITNRHFRFKKVTLQIIDGYKMNASEDPYDAWTKNNILEFYVKDYHRIERDTLIGTCKVKLRDLYYPMNKSGSIQTCMARKNEWYTRIEYKIHWAVDIEATQTFNFRGYRGLGPEGMTIVIAFADVISCFLLSSIF